MWSEHQKVRDIFSELKDMGGFEHLFEEENIDFDAGKIKKRKSKNDSGPQKQSRATKHIRWDQTLEGHLVYYASKFDAWKKTSVSMDEKWPSVCHTMWAAKLFPLEFTRDDIKSASLRKQFDRLWEKVSARYSLEKEGSNLSALPDSWDSIPEYEKTLYNLIVQKLNAKQEKEALSAKDLARQKMMLQEESTVLNKMGCSTSTNVDKVAAELAEIDGDIELNKTGSPCDTIKTVSISTVSDPFELTLNEVIKTRIASREKRDLELHNMQIQLQQAQVEMFNNMNMFFKNMSNK